MTDFTDRPNPSPTSSSEVVFLRMVRRVLVVGIVLVALTAMTGGSGSRQQPTQIPADASVSWLHSTVANDADRAKGWHPCEHDCHRTSCDKICHFR